MSLQHDQYERAYLDMAKKDNSQALATLVLAVHAALPTGIHSHSGISKLVKNEFGAKIGDAAIRVDLKCDNQELFVYRKQVRRTLKEIRGRLKLKRSEKCQS